MAQINPKITIGSIYFGMLLLSAAVMILAVRLAVADELVDALKADAEQGDAAAMSLLGYIYETGEGVPQNDTEAVRWFRMSAERGFALAQVSLGLMYANGRGVPQNDTEAVRWFRMSAERGFAKAQVKLGLMYFTGRGVPRDDVEAVRLYRLAAEQGDAEGQVHLGVMYGLGQGVPKDDVQAYAWLNIGVAQTGNEESREFLEMVAEEMTAYAITKAQSLSREYWETYGPNRASSE